MSFPTHQMQHLTIGGSMNPQTRVQTETERRSLAQQRRRRRERLERQAAQQGQASSASGQIQNDIVVGHTEILYNVRSLAPASRITAARGLSSERIMVDFVKTHEYSESGPYIALQVSERRRICVFGPQKVGRRITCACAEFMKDPSRAVCEHIYVSIQSLQAQLC
jgi:hypothetical protein